MSSQVEQQLRKIWESLLEGNVSNSNLETILTNGTQETKIVDNNGYTIIPNGTPIRGEVEITRPQDTTGYSIGDAINTYTANVKQKDTVTLSGTGGSVNISIVNIANRTVAFDTNLTTTAAKFVTDHAAAFLPLVVVTSSGADIIFEAATAGVPFSSPFSTTISGDLTGTTANTTANITVSAYEIANASNANGGGGFLCNLKVETNITAMAGASLRFYFFKDIPSSVTADNAAMTISYTNSSKRIYYVDVALDPLVAGSDTIFGQSNALFLEYATTLTSLYFTVQTNSAFTPTSGGKIKVIASLLKIA